MKLRELCPYICGNQQVIIVREINDEVNKLYDGDVRDTPVQLLDATTETNGIIAKHKDQLVIFVK